MPFMQETPRSLRIYLVLVGVLGTVVTLPGVFSVEGGIIGRLISLVGTAIAVGYAWAGFTFETTIVEHPRRIEQVLFAGLGFAIVMALIVIIFAPGTEETYGVVGRALLVTLITLYLLKNVRRIARETRRQAPRPTGGPA